MTFTKTPPTKPGAYWWNTSKPHPLPVLIELTTRLGVIVNRKDGRPANQFGGEWCGPLVPADEVEKAWDEASSGIPWSESRARRVMEGEEA